MSVYLDRLTSEFEAITAGIDDTLNRAAEEQRELSADESTTVERSQTRAEELRKSIEHYGTIEETRSKVATVRSKVPVTPIQRSTQVAQPEDPDAAIQREFPDGIGDYLVTLHRATAERDPASREKIDRAVANQTTADIPGLIPRPILGPIISLLDGVRPFIESTRRGVLPGTGGFDRPIITQHVQVGIQAQEKTQLASRQMVIGKLPVAAKTYGGVVDVSYQAVDWSNPAVMGILAQDFAFQYALETDTDAGTDFLASVTSAPIPIPEATAGAVTSALFTGAQASLVNGRSAMPDTLWVSPDVWGQLGGLVNAFGQPIFPSITPGNPTGSNVTGFRLVVDVNFPAQTMVLGPSRFLEWYENVRGLITVAEPTLFGQDVAYGGYGAFINTVPAAFSRFTVPPVDVDTATTVTAKAK
jgi:HK97 family phage major capsid protein